jgi:hypothetical protein
MIKDKTLEADDFNNSLVEGADIKTILSKKKKLMLKNQSNKNLSRNILKMGGN